MSEKNLSESEWKKFAKGRDLKDALFVKALIALEKARSPEDALSALDDLEKQADALRKSAKADKELTAYLDGVDKSLDKERKLNKTALKEAESAEDEEDESPALLTSKMVPLVRQVKKGDEMQVLLANTGKEVAVLLSRRSISPSRRKLMTEYLNSGAPKFIAGTCIFEENAYTFVVKTQAAGLAKRIKAALLKQVDLRLKVRVRGEDPDDVDDDGEEDESSGGEQVASKDQSSTAPPNASDAADVAAAQLMQAMNQLTPRIKQFIEAQPARRETLLRAVAALQTQIKNKAVTEARASLEAVVAMLRSNAAAPAATAPRSKPANEAERRARWAEAKEAWLAAIETVDGQIARVSAQMRASGDAELEQIAERGLPALTGNHKTPVMKALFDVEGSTGEARVKAAAAGRQAIAAFRSHLDSYALLQALDEHAPAAFGAEMTVRQTIGEGLSHLAAALDDIDA